MLVPLVERDKYLAEQQEVSIHATQELQAWREYNGRRTWAQESADMAREGERMTRGEWSEAQRKPWKWIDKSHPCKEHGETDCGRCSRKLSQLMKQEASWWEKRYRRLEASGETAEGTAQRYLGRGADDGWRRIATDGGAQNEGGCGRAGWAFAFECIDGMVGKVGGRICGLDQSPHMAELIALLQVAMAANAAGVKAWILVDNLNVVRTANRLLEGHEPPINNFRWWHRVQTGISQGEFMVSWIPPHGRKSEWRPPGNESAHGGCHSLPTTRREARRVASESTGTATGRTV